MPLQRQNVYLPEADKQFFPLSAFHGVPQGSSLLLTQSFWSYNTNDTQSINANLTNHIYFHSSSNFRNPLKKPFVFPSDITTLARCNRARGSSRRRKYVEVRWEHVRHIPYFTNNIVISSNESLQGGDNNRTYTGIRRNAETIRFKRIARQSDRIWSWCWNRDGSNTKKEMFCKFLLQHLDLYRNAIVKKSLMAILIDIVGGFVEVDSALSF